MYPVIRPDNADHSRAVWCSKDRAKAWLDLAAGDKPKVPAAGATCANPVDKVLELGRSLRVTGTPTLFFANGERAGGGMELGALRAKLDEVARQPAKKTELGLGLAPRRAARVSTSGPAGACARRARRPRSRFPSRNPRAPRRGSRRPCPAPPSGAAAAAWTAAWWWRETPARPAAPSADRPRGCSRR